MTMKEYERKDRNCVSGTRACRRASYECKPDADENCGWWASLGYCKEEHVEFMAAYCQTSCGCESSTDKCTCGVSKRKTEAGGITRISGGNEADPHEFPWMVRITGGCAGKVCGGVLVSPRVVLSAFHCAIPYDSPYQTYPCDHSDGRTVALLGMHYNGDQEDRIPIVEVYYPRNPNRVGRDYSSHDFVLYRLAKPARYTNKVGPICLPEPNSEYGGEKATAAGWGRTYGPSTSHQSPFLKKVELRVNPKRYKHKYVFGTKLEKIGGVYQDPCSGDSGGPLMFYNKTTSKYVLIGTVSGEGYDCRTDTTSYFERTTDGIWNKVSAHMEWIKKKMDELGETVCK